MSWNQAGNSLPGSLHTLGPSGAGGGGGTDSLGLATVGDGTAAAQFVAGHGLNTNGAALPGHNHMNNNSSGAGQDGLLNMEQENSAVGGNMSAAAAAASAAANALVAAGTAASGSPEDDGENGDDGSDGEDGMKGDDAEGIWSQDIERSFQEALAIYPPCGRRKIILSDEGKMYGRNELIARYIKLRTGKVRTRKQVSSHIQVLARKKSRELQSRLKDAHTEKDQGALHSLIHSLPGMSSAQIVSAHFHNDQEDPNAAAAGGGGVPPNAGVNHMGMKSESSQLADGGVSTNSHAAMLPRTVGAASAAISTACSSGIIVKNEPGPVSAAMAVHNNTVVPPVAAGAAMWQGLPTTLRPFGDPLAYNVPTHGMVAGAPSNFIMASPPGPGVHPIPMVPPRMPQPIAHGGMYSPSSSFQLVSLTGYVEDSGQTELAADGSSAVPRHCFVHIPPNTNFNNPLLEAIDIRQINDKFPGLKDLYDKGPQDAFFLVKFWADINVSMTEDSKPFVTTSFTSSDQVKCRSTTKVCSFGSLVVEKLETQKTQLEANGQNMLRLHTPMCDYMVKFLRLLLQLNDRKKMNSVLENFTLLQLITNHDTNELLLCLAFAFEVSMSEGPGTYHNIYRLKEDL